MSQNTILKDERNLTLVCRKSKINEDSYDAAISLKNYFGDKWAKIPYSLENCVNLIKAGVRSREIILTKRGNKHYIENLEKWFINRILPNTVTIDWDEYLNALSSSFKLVTIAEPARTDFGGSRQREFGQQWTDFARGYLGEIALKKSFLERFNVEVKLEQRGTGEGLEKYLPTDVTKIKENGKWRDVKNTLSIKTSKLRSLWLGIPNDAQLSYSKAFAFVKIGIPLNHLAIFLKETGGIKPLFSEERELKEVLEKIPPFKHIPSYIPGFAWRDDFNNGELETYETGKCFRVIGGIGEKPEIIPGDKKLDVEGIGEASEKYLAACGALKWENKNWIELIKSM